MMPEQADENIIALSKKFEASKLPNDMTYLHVFVIERVSLLVRLIRCCTPNTDPPRTPPAAPVRVPCC
jgi:hypothetical protein